MKKAILILIAIILVVGVCFFVTRELNKEDKAGNNVVNTNSSQNNVKEKKVNETSNNKNNIIENNITNTVNVENAIQNTETVESNTETFEDTPQTEEEKAISIVKKDWGANDVNVKIAIEGINDNGTYIVTVRDSETTEAKAFYKVNVKSGTFEKNEMM